MHVADGLTLAVWRLQLAHAHSATADRVTLSAGCVSHIPRDGDDVHCVIEAADQALYQAKHCGRNRAFRASGLEQAA
jgi:PleD family two-component response regulator